MSLKSFIQKPLILFGILFCMAASCEKNDHPFIPNRPVNFVIYPNEAAYLNLNYHGGYEYFTGGVSGIVVYRLDDWTFTAFDRACPYDWDSPDSWIWVENGITLRCQECNSLFNILDGGIISGPAKYPLKRYHTKYDGLKLRIYS